MSRRRSIHLRAMRQEVAAGRIKEVVSVDQWRMDRGIDTKGKRSNRQTKPGKVGVRLGYRASRRMRKFT